MSRPSKDLLQKMRRRRKKKRFTLLLPDTAYMRQHSLVRVLCRSIEIADKGSREGTESPLIRTTVIRSILTVRTLWELVKKSTMTLIVRVERS